MAQVPGPPGLPKHTVWLVLWACYAQPCLSFAVPCAQILHALPTRISLSTPLHSPISMCVNTWSSWPTKSWHLLLAELVLPILIYAATTGIFTSLQQANCPPKNAVWSQRRKISAWALLPGASFTRVQVMGLAHFAGPRSRVLFMRHGPALDLPSKCCR